MVSFYNKNENLIISLLKDSMNGNKKVHKFIANNFTVHIKMLISEIVRAKSMGLAANFSVADIAFHLVAPIIVPRLILKVTSKTNFLNSNKFLNQNIKLDYRKLLEFSLDSFFKETLLKNK